MIDEEQNIIDLFLYYTMRTTQDDINWDYVSHCRYIGGQWNFVTFDLSKDTLEYSVVSE